MIKRTITYTDYNGVERKEVFYFNISEAELAKMELGTAGGMSAMLTRIIDSREDTEIANIFEQIVLAAYGEKSPDGKYFRKDPQMSKDFSYTEAYNKLYMELATDSKAAAEFIRGILPEKYQQANNNQALPAA